MEPTAQPTPTVLPPTPQPIPNTTPKKIGTFIISFFALALLGTAAIFAYAPPTFLPASIRTPLLVAGYKIPLLPKTSEQVLLASANASQNLKAYNANLSLSAKLGAGAISAGSMDLNIDGPIDFRDTQNAKFDLTVATNVNVAGTNYSGKGRLRGLDKTIYLKLDELSDSVLDIITRYTAYPPESIPNLDEVKTNLTKFYTNWMSYNTSGLSTPARDALERNTQNQSLIDNTRKKTQDILNKNTILPKVKNLGIESIDGVPAYHLQVTPSQEDIKTILKEVTDKDVDQIATSINSLTIDTWISVKTASPVKMSMQTTINISSMLGSFSGYMSPTVIASQLGQQNLAISTVLLIKNLDTTQITAPTPALDPTKYYDAFTGSLKTQAQKESDQLRAKQSEELTTLAKALTDYYLANSTYPSSYASVDSKHTGYQYTTSSDRKKYVLYTKDASGSNYGISSGAPYPHQISSYDLP